MHASSTPVIIANHPTDYSTEYKARYVGDEFIDQNQSADTIKHLSGKMYPPLFKRHRGQDGAPRYGSGLI